MTHHDFRRIALNLSQAVEGAHMGHPDFRLHNRIFATIHPDPAHGMVKLTPSQQQEYLRDYPQTFTPESGAWGRGGCTRIIFASASEEVAGEVLALAWQNAVAENAARASKRASDRPRRATKVVKTPRRRGKR